MDFQDKLKRAFFITFTLLMLLGAHYFQHNQGGSGLQLPQNNIVWIFFSFLIGLGLWKASEQQKIIYSRFTLLLLVAIVLFIIPIFYPNNLLADQSYTRLLGLFAGFLFFLSLQQFQFKTVEIQRLLILIVAAGFLQACYSLMQDYLLPAQNIFGYDVGYGRPYGIFQQPNVLASFMATTLILSGYLLQQINCKKLQLFLLLTTLLNMWVITLTVSRAGYLGTILALLIFIPWAWQNNKKKLVIFIAAISLGIAFASITIKGEALESRSFDNIAEGWQRLVHYSNSWDLIKKHPFLGSGYGGFEKNYLLNTAERVANGMSIPELKSLTHPHNDILFWAVEGGILPLLAILLLIVSFIRLLRPFKFTYALALMSLVIPIAVHTQTEYPLYHSALHWLVLLVLVFFIDSEAKLAQQQSFHFTFALRVSGLLIPMFTTVFMVSNLYTISKITEFERSKQPDINLLMDIVNPLVFADRFNYHLSYFRLALAVHRQDKKEILQIIEWTRETLSQTPKTYFYILLHQAYVSNEMPEKAQETLDYALYLYPKDKQFKSIYEQVNATKKTQASAALQSEE